MAMVHIGNILPGSAQSAAMETRIPWSALGYSGGTQVITGISGSAIGGNIDSATVSAIASSYVVSGVSGKVDQSAMSGYVPLSAASSWSSDLQTLSAAVSSMQNYFNSIYTLSAGNGLQISSNTATKVTVIGMA